MAIPQLRTRVVDLTKVGDIAGPDRAASNWYAMCHLPVGGGVSAEQSKDSNTRIVGKGVEDRRDVRRAGRPRVLVVDDHAGVRNRVVAALAGICEIVGTVEDGAAALRAYESLKPTVIVLDSSMPDMNGVEVTRHIRQHDSTVRIVIIRRTTTLN